MAVFTDIGHLPTFNKAVITIGTFDGVHAGHRAILREVVAHAEEVGGESVLLTFEPHPRKVLFPDQPIGIITPLDKKIQLITETGIQHVVVVPFTLDFAALSATEYIEQFLAGVFHPDSIVIGYDHHFGHDRTGNIDLLKQYVSKYNFNIVEIPAQLIKEAAVSSTKIRNAILSGSTEEANSMLGRSYSFIGSVVHGKKLGRTLGYPTANLAPLNTDQVLPGPGIFAVRVICNGTRYGGMMSIGYNPTVSNSNDLKLEVNIFDFNDNIYETDIEVFFVKRLRDEMKFASLEELVAQIDADKANALAVL